MNNLPRRSVSAPFELTGTPLDDVETTMGDDIRSSDAWRPIEGFEDLYAVSAYGEVFSFKLDRRMKPCPDKDGYPRVILHAGGKIFTRKVHRLVAEAFHGDKKNILHTQVDHIDGNRANANAANLRWVSHAQNHFARRGKRVSAKVSLSKLTPDQARTIKNTEIRWGSISKLARDFGVPRHVVCDVLRGRTWKDAK